MERYWQQLLDSNQIVLIDGATGTELQRRGVPMDKVAWSGAAVLTHPDIVRETHEDYIRAGANVITTNTFGSTRQMLGPAGYGDQVEVVHRAAVSLARQACDNAAEKGVAVAGSISTEPPAFDRGAFLSPDEELLAYQEAAGLLADAGVDLIALEMINETVHAARAMQAALETNLPVWLGVGCKKSGDGRIVSFDHLDLELATVLDALIPMGPTVVNIMHSEIAAIPEAIKLVRERWSGPIGVYPESGYFKKPNWKFVDVISPADLVTEALGWVAAGARLLGGCCGTNPDHIKALQAAMPELRAAMGARG
ncbi:MAG: homocysteine S-methyltransferase family protein [Proteobacteria bacterium]|nr:homocysteine S-methyltransferase family protein [Pseudomonadota bacterium]